MNIKLIYSRPRHPQSQGKVERYHKTLRSRMEYDLQKIRQDGVNWAKQLSLYQRILTNNLKEVIAYKTPFEIYFARKCNAFRESKLQDEILPSARRVRPTKNDRNRRSQQALKLRMQLKKPRADVADAANTTSLKSALGLQHRRKSVCKFERVTIE